MILQVTRSARRVSNANEPTSNASGILSSNFARLQGFQDQETRHLRDLLPCKLNQTLRSVHANKGEMMKAMTKVQPQDTTEGSAGRVAEATTLPTQSQCHNLGTHVLDGKIHDVEVQESRIPAASGSRAAPVIRSQDKPASPPMRHARTSPQEADEAQVARLGSPNVSNAPRSTDPRRANADTRLSGTDVVPQASPLADEDDLPANFASPMQSGGTWSAQGMPSLANFPPMNAGSLSDNVLSPSVSSGYCAEDGIFEPGSAYQNLFQSLRSHVFRTAQFELNRQHGNMPSDQGCNAPGPSVIDLYNIPTGDSSNSYADGDGEGSRTFELQPAQEYLLWKAWTEEVSNWVCSSRAEPAAGPKANEYSSTSSIHKHTSVTTFRLLQRKGPISSMPCSRLALAIWSRGTAGCLRLSPWLSTSTRSIYFYLSSTCATLLSLLLA